MFLFLQANPKFKIIPLPPLEHILINCKDPGLTNHLFVHKDNKPISDSLFEQNINDVFLFDGVIANSKDLLNKHGLSSIPNLVKLALSSDPKIYLSQFHGQFCALYYSIHDNKLRIFTNQTNSMRVYYYASKNTCIASTSLKTILSLLIANDISFSIDEIGARMILTYGYLLSDYSTIKEIRNLGAGKYIEYTNSNFQISPYHFFNNKELYNDISKTAPILDDLFKKSVSCGFEKDKEHNKKHIAFLSGGLDSRQTVCNAFQLGYKNVSCLNFSQPGYADEKIAKDIATKLGFEFISYPLTNGDYLLNIDNSLLYNEGQIILHGAAHLFEAISSLDLDKYGILHSGQIGDYVLGSYLNSPHHETADIRSGAYSNRLLETIIPDIVALTEQYENQELFHLYNRCFNAAMNGDMACSVNSHSVSPFLHPEFAQFGFNISPKLRYNTFMYYYWMKHFNSLGASYPWEKTGSNLFTPKWVANAKSYLQRGTYKVYRIITNTPNKRSMNPFDLWWNENKVLRDFFTPRFMISEKYSSLLSPELMSDMNELNSRGTFSEKLQVYTLIRGLEYLEL